MNLDKLLTREQKESAIKTALTVINPRLVGEIAAVSYDRRLAFDFEVSRGPAGKARVLFALSIGDERFNQVIADCAEACETIRYDSVSAVALRGGSRFFEEEEES
jgi:hypothetical protein